MAEVIDRLRRQYSFLSNFHPCAIFLDGAVYLLATGSAELIEGNDWGDDYWGRATPQGKNHLGVVLMQVREELRDWSRPSGSPAPFMVR